MNIVK